MQIKNTKAGRLSIILDEDEKVEFCRQAYFLHHSTIFKRITNIIQSCIDREIIDKIKKSVEADDNYEH